MNVWFVVYIAGVIGVTVGPMPVDMDACLKYAKSQEYKWQMKPNKSELEKSMTFTCIEQVSRPKAGEQ